MKQLLGLLALLAVAACAGDDDRAISSPVAATFVAGSTDRIEVTVADRQPVETAELVAPDGTATAAYQIDRSKTIDDGGGAQPSVGVGVFGGSSGRIGTSVGINFPVGRSGAPSDPVIDSRIIIKVPDMASYRAGWTGYRLRLHLGTTETNRRVMEIPAPRPPEE